MEIFRNVGKMFFSDNFRSGVQILVTSKNKMRVYIVSWILNLNIGNIIMIKVDMLNKHVNWAAIGL